MGNKIKYFIDKHYNDFKVKLMNCYSNIPFNEDVFHNTLIKCININDDNLEIKDIPKYIYEAFKLNSIRELLYHRNVKRDYTFDLDNIKKYYYDTKLDYKNIINIINKKFGDNLTNLFYKWRCEGFTIAELEKQFNVNDLYYKFRKIRLFLNKLKNEMI